MRRQETQEAVGWGGVECVSELFEYLSPVSLKNPNSPTRFPKHVLRDSDIRLLSSQQREQVTQILTLQSPMTVASMLHRNREPAKAKVVNFITINVWHKTPSPLL